MAMNPSCTENILTEDEREFFNSNGFLVVEDALDASATARLVEVMDRVDTRERTEALAGKLLSVADVIHEDTALVDLVDWPTTFPKVWGILGWNIYLYHSHLDVTPNENAWRQDWRVAWHQDSMRVNDENESNPRLQGRRRLAWQLRGLRHGLHRGCDRRFLRLGNAGNLPRVGRWRDLVTPQQRIRKARKRLGSDRWQGCHAYRR